MKLFLLTAPPPSLPQPLISPLHPHYGPRYASSRDLEPPRASVPEITNLLCPAHHSRRDNGSMSANHHHHAIVTAIGIAIEIEIGNGNGSTSASTINETETRDRDRGRPASGPPPAGPHESAQLPHSLRRRTPPTSRGRRWRGRDATWLASTLARSTRQYGLAYAPIRTTPFPAQHTATTITGYAPDARTRTRTGTGFYDVAAASSVFTQYSAREPERETDGWGMRSYCPAAPSAPFSFPSAATAAATATAAAAYFGTWNATTYTQHATADSCTCTPLAPVTSESNNAVAHAGAGNRTVTAAIVVYWSCIQLAFEPWPAHSQPLPIRVPSSSPRGQHVIRRPASLRLLACHCGHCIRALTQKSYMSLTMRTTVRH